MQLIEIVALSFISAIQFLLALFVLLRNWKNQIHQYFAVYGFSLVLWSISNFLADNIKNYAGALFWTKTTFITPAILVWGFLGFTVIFPISLVRFSVTKQILLILPAVIISILSISNLIVKDVILKDFGVEVVFGDLGLVYTAYLILYVLGAVGLLVWKSYKSRGLARVQLQFVLFGFLLFASLALLTNLVLPQLTGSFEITKFGPYFSILWIGFTSYAIIKHRLLDIRLVVARTVAYLLLLTIIGGLYIVGLFLAGYLFIPLTLGKQQLLLSVMLTLIAALTFQPLRKLLERLTDRIFYKDRYDEKELLARLTRIMALTLKLDELTHNVLREIVSQMKVRRCAFVLVEDNHIYDVKSEGYDENPEFVDTEMSALLNKRQILVYDELMEGAIKNILRNLSISIAIPLVAEFGNVGLLVLSEKSSGDIYSEGDIKVLEIIAPEMVVAIQNARSYEEIKRFSVTLQQEVERATRDLRIANEKLKELDRLKDEFVSVASHELRTPMTAIKSYLWMALAGKGGELTDKQKYYLERAYLSTDRLIRLVNNMLNVSRIESGRIELELEKLDIGKLACDIVDEVRPRASELGIKVTCHPPKDLPEVLADPDKIKEVLMNLVGNSLKFTPKGGKVDINFSVKDGMVETSVSDTGKGIAKEDMPKLFKKFGLIEGTYATDQQDQGSGLGLYISWNIILLHHGVIKAESEGLGKGATFTFSLPIFKEEDIAKIKQRKEEKEAVGLVSVGI